MDKKKIFRIKPKVKQIMEIIGLGKYLLAGEAFLIIVSAFVCTLFIEEGTEMIELLRLSFKVSLVISGMLILLATILDMAYELIKWFATHKVTILKVEEKNLKIIE